MKAAARPTSLDSNGCLACEDSGAQSSLLKTPASNSLEAAAVAQLHVCGPNSEDQTPTTGPGFGWDSVTFPQWTGSPRKAKFCPAL